MILRQLTRRVLRGCREDQTVRRPSGCSQRTRVPDKPIRGATGASKPRPYPHQPPVMTQSHPAIILTWPERPQVSNSYARIHGSRSPDILADVSQPAQTVANDRFVVGIIALFAPVGGVVLPATSDRPCIEDGISYPPRSSSVGAMSSRRAPSLRLATGYSRRPG